MSKIDGTAKLGDGCTLGNNLFIGAGAKIGERCVIENNVVIHDGTEIGDETILQDGCVLGKQPKLGPLSTAKGGNLEPLKIGKGCVVGTNSVIYAGSVFGKSVVIGDLASVRERCTIGENCVIGRGVTVENDTLIGSFTKIQSNAYITAYVNIEDHVFIAPSVVTTNDNFMGRTEKRFQFVKGAKIRRGARVGGGAVLLPGVEIGEEAFVAAGSVVTKDVPPKTLVMGAPAKPVRKVPEEELLENQ